MNTSKNNVTLCCVVYNEEHRIERFIDYHKPLFKQVVIVDQSSTDSTRDIILSKNCRLLRDINRVFAEPSRHLAASVVDTEWIMFLDADEYLSPEFISKIDELINNENDGYILTRDNLSNGELISSETNQYRLFKRGCAFFNSTLHGGIEPVPTITFTNLLFPCIIHDKSPEEDKLDYDSYLQIIEEKPEIVHTPWYTQYLVNTTKNLSDLITLVVTTSAKPTNPKIDHVKRLFESFNYFFDLHSCNKILVADAFHNNYNIWNQEYTEKFGNANELNYNYYKLILRDYCREINVQFVESRKHGYMTGTWDRGMDFVGTPFYMFVPDDFWAVNHVPTRDILNNLVLHPRIKKLNFHNYKLQTDDWNSHIEKDVDAPFPCCMTNHWSNNTHIGYTDYFKKALRPRIRELGLYPLELTIDKEMKEYIGKTSFYEGIKKYGTYIYGNVGDEPAVLHDFSYKNA